MEHSKENGNVVPDREERIGFKVRQLSNMIKSHGEQHGLRYDCQNISMMQRWIIGYLSEHEYEDVYQKNLEEHMHIGKSTLTEILHLMEKNGLVIRQTSEKDGRYKKLILTRRAQDIHEEVLHDVAQYEQQLRKGISPEDLQMFFRVLNQIIENAGEKE